MAALFGAKRTPLSGSNSGHETESDSLHPRVFIECKRRARMWVWGLFQEVLAKALKEKKIPLLALKEKGGRSFLFVLRVEDMAALVKEMQLGRERTDEPPSSGGLPRVESRSGA